MYPFAQSPTGITKFQVLIPGLATSPGEPGIPVLKADTTRFPGIDFYDIIAGQGTHQFHPTIPTTPVWGYADAVTKDLTNRYLGGVIIAKRGVPVRLQIANLLPSGHLLPVDPTLSEAEGAGRDDRIAVHLHGGFVFWDDDGGPFAWFSNPNNPGNFVHGSSFINGPTTPPGEGTATYDYPNDQSARFIWYHDHAYGLTRTNVYAGLASAYLITDTAEDRLLTDGVLPDPNFLNGELFHDGRYRLGIPIIIQDKTFWTGPTGDDPGYATVPPQTPGVGSLWYPWEYEGALDPPGDDLAPMTLPVPAGSTTTARWGASPLGPFPNPSTVPEFFSDTIVINGAAYPRMTVEPRRYRLRFINASNARFYNLGLYVAEAGNPDGITLAPFNSDIDPNGNVILAPTNAPGPAFIQIGNECGFLPAPAVFSTDNPTPGGATSGVTNKNSNLPMGYKAASTLEGARADAGITRHVAGDNIRLGPDTDPTIGSATRYNLLMAPAERPDVVIDFSDFAGQSLILYNDAPAPFPGGDTRNDYFVVTPASGLPPNYNDLTSIGGAPPTTPGMGPDTRVLMRIDVTAEIPPGRKHPEPNFAETVVELQTALRQAFNQTQPDPASLVPSVEEGKSLLEDNDDSGRLRQLLGDDTGTSFTLLDKPIDMANEGEVQRWNVFNLTADTHPMHFHLVNVAVRSRAQWAFNVADGTPDLSTGVLMAIPGTDHPADLNEQGWKETVRMNPGEVTTVDMKFDLPVATAENPAPPNSPRLFASFGIEGAEYVWHCHILEHEEHDMMHALVVVPAQTPPPGRKSEKHPRR